jgi:DNA polymerase-1
MPKEERSSFYHKKNSKTGVQPQVKEEMTKDQILYAAYDVVLDWKVYQSQRAEIDENDLNIWKEIELPFLWVLLGMSGVKLDVDKWLQVAEKTRKGADNIQAKYPDINLNAPGQVLKELQKDKRYRKLGGTGEEFLAPIREECKFADDVLTFRSFAKRASTYGKKFVEDFVEADGKVYGDIYQIGAENGRTSCRNPNLQNQPNEDDYRSCYIASEDGMLAIADWSAQEPRFAAYLSQDQGLIDILNSDKVLYVEIARDALDIKITKKDKIYKDIKSTILGLFYGMSAWGLAKRIGVSEQEAEEMIDKILDAYPGINDYVKRQKKSKDYVHSIRGRKFWLNKYLSQWERNALNDPISASSADAMKIASYRFAVEWSGENFYDNIPLVLLVHDEIVIDVHESGIETAARKLEDKMVSVASEMHPGIRGAVGVSTGKNWSAKE